MRGNGPPGRKASGICRRSPFKGRGAAIGSSYDAGFTFASVAGAAGGGWSAGVSGCKSTGWAATSQTTGSIASR